MTTLKVKQAGSWTAIAGEVYAQNPVNAAITQLQSDTARMGGTWRRVTNLVMTSGAGQLVPWDTELLDTNNFFTPTGTDIIVPAGCAGVYVIAASFYFNHESGMVQLNVTNSTGVGTPSGRANGSNGWGSASTVAPFAVGEKFSVSVVQLSGSSQNGNGYVSFWRVSA